MSCQNGTMGEDIELGPLGFNYLNFHYCIMAEYQFLSYSLFLIQLLLLFYLLGNTADAYFSPLLSCICEKLHISYDVAGVTLLAFGNGAPDVFSSLAAFSTGANSTGLNALLGGGAFVSTIVVGCVVLSATKLSVHPRALARDITTYILSLCLVVYMGKQEKITLQEAILFPILYIAYVATVIAADLVHRHTADFKQSNDVMSAFWHVSTSKSFSGVSCEAPSSYSFVTRVGEESESNNGMALEMTVQKQNHSPDDKSDFLSTLDENYFPTLHDSDSLSAPLILSDDVEVVDTVQGDSSSLRTGELLSNRVAGGNVWEMLYWNHMRWRLATKRRLQNIGSFSKNSLLFYIFLFPYRVALDFTIPTLDPECWSRAIATLFPYSCSFGVLMLTDQLSWLVEENRSIALLYFACICPILSFYIFCTTHRTKPPGFSTNMGSTVWLKLKSYLLVILFLATAFFMCILWINAIASELVALITSIAYLTHLSKSILGTTVLAWGNSIGDLITNVAVSRAGYPEMALAGCFGGPVFNLLMGLGIPLLKPAFSKANGIYFELDKHTYTSISFLFMTLIISFLVYFVYGVNKSPKLYAHLLIALYIIYTCVNVAEVIFFN